MAPHWKAVLGWNAESQYIRDRLAPPRHCLLFEDAVYGMEDTFNRMVDSAADLMLATPAAKPFDRQGWIFELKLDGFRALAIHRGKEVRLLSRRGNDLLPRFPEIAACLRELPDIVLDGELVVLDEHGKPVFERVSRRARTRKPISVQEAARRDPAVLFAFDILSLRSCDVRKLALLQRKKIVQDALGSLPENTRIRPVQSVGEQGTRLYEAAEALQLEGIVAKKADSPYKGGGAAIG